MTVFAGRPRQALATTNRHGFDAVRAEGEIHMGADAGHPGQADEAGEGLGYRLEEASVALERQLSHSETLPRASGLRRAGFPAARNIFDAPSILFDALPSLELELRFRLSSLTRGRPRVVDANSLVSLGRGIAARIASTRRAAATSITRSN